MGEGQRTQLDVLKLQERAYALKQEKLDLELEIESDRRKLEALKDEVLEAKMHRIAMEEIMNCSFESLCRSCGIVKSFYGVDAEDDEE